jgi:ubiquinone/menaquinone biosynthesis C-methylase UbiE
MMARIFGRGMERIPNSAFRMMSLVFAFRDRFTTPWSVLDQFGIEEGQTVVDYGCGPGSYLRRASELVGTHGRVLAVDIHELAIKAVERRIARERLGNVTALLAGRDQSRLPDETADVIYALDMFHMVRHPEAFLKELKRICKGTGTLYIDNGHQSREEARAKVRLSHMWEIERENERYMKCNPIKSGKDDPATVRSGQ